LTPVVSGLRRIDERPTRHRTMAEYALEQLREAIILGDLAAGTPLRLDDLARSLGMSISPIREAVRQLEALGLAKHVPHQGARVLDFDVDDLRDLFSIRLALESLAVRRAAERATEDLAGTGRRHLARLDDARAAGDVRAALRAHGDFHFSLYEASGSSWLVGLIRPVWDRSERFRPALLLSAGEVQDLHRALDERLLEACVARDPDAAAAALAEHLELIGRFFPSAFGLAAERTGTRR
jgi:DNA-binding GntR family transcriptional regulator